MFGHALIVAPDIDWEEVMRDIEATLQTTKDVKGVPAYLLDPKKLAKVVYEFWLNTLNSDGIETEQPEWDGLADEERDHLIEAFQTNVTEPVKKIVDALQSDFAKRVQQAAAEEIARRTPPVLVPSVPSALEPATPKWPCYACGQRYTSEGPSGMCATCKR